MNAHCESSKTAQQLAPQTVQYGAESTKNFIRDPSYLLAERARSAETEFVLSQNQQRTLHKLVEMGEFGTHQILIVDQITKHYNRRGIPLIELIRSINQGITDALDKFELVNGYCFSSYLVHCIYHYIERTLLSKNSLSGSFQTRRAPVLSFDNPAHQRWRI
jgi:DNA-directed RNA polymerase sigma subunit (sigma70/sigma32)